MSPAIGTVLLQAQHIIRAYLARGAVAQDDIPELAADGTAQAARILDSCVRNAKPVPAANSVAHYVIASMRSGRRHGYSGRQDVMSPAAQLDGNVSLSAMDAPVGASDDDGNELTTLHDSIASDSEDVDVAVARHLDWGLVDLDARRRAVLRETAEGYGPDEIALHLGVSAPRVVQLRQSCRKEIVAAWGSNGIQDVTTASRWRSGMRAGHERRAGRAERRA